MTFKMEIRGIADVNRTLRTIAPKEARNLMRTTVHRMARGIAYQAKTYAPIDDGDLKSAIRHKRENMPAPYIVRSTVRVSRSAFYWRFLEYGDGPDGIEHAFFYRAMENFRREIDQIYLHAFTTQLEKRLATLRKKAGR